MKVLRILVLLLGSAFTVYAQVDCKTDNEVYVYDAEGQLIKNAKLEVFKIDEKGRRKFAFEPQKIEAGAYLFISYLGVFEGPQRKNFYVGGNYTLKVSAEGFEPVEQGIKFRRCNGQTVRVNLKRTNPSHLTGTVYDANGAVIVNARVTAVGQNRKKFEALTNSEGIYILNLPFNPYDAKNTKDFKISTYEIIAEAKHFERFVLKDFKFVPSWKGKMHLDIALDVLESNNCGAGGCITPVREPIKTTEGKISDRILQKPLDELPKDTNKTERKNINNKQ